MKLYNVTDHDEADYFFSTKTEALAYAKDQSIGEVESLYSTETYKLWLEVYEMGFDLPLTKATICKLLSREGWCSSITKIARFADGKSVPFEQD